MFKHGHQIAGKYPPLIPITEIGIEKKDWEEKKTIFVLKQF